ncbi:tryptophanyl-tRNA synthetase [Spiroplasma sabaudiense Ar-1343]|uniref:Tryptophan--tRNA ligase n=1 Tax=Spiroplasma sabaudiense Ar-1343 TaxID=1276257 RepID=W6AAL7_9MOLU|nr:tryptophan--tRNA ligase [Spiroplasma sabaudiense]AHI54193.1 tryptophanyl-tRNA synthetase [Spiroplasma sabaudiense Ar-1343]
MSQKRLISGITSTGKLTLGNYLGAMQQFVELQDDYEMMVFIANLHAIVLPIEAKTLKENIKSMVALYFACGLDPNKATVFLQSDILEVTNLAWILSCHTTIGELERMTQFKDKSTKVRSDNGTNFIPTGLLMYPTLMAADILLYDAQAVPVGKDQKQHIELARNIAERMNNKFGELFVVPEPIIKETGAKIMDLQDPSKKMSKSATNPKSYIGLLDDLNQVRNKIKAAITDSENLVRFDMENKPGVSNLMTIYSCITKTTIAEIEVMFANKNYGEFKNAVGDVVVNLLEGIQKKYNQLLNSQEVEMWLQQGAKKAQIIAQKKLKKVLWSTGLNYKK